MHLEFENITGILLQGALSEEAVRTLLVDEISYADGLEHLGSMKLPVPLDYHGDIADVLHRPNATLILGVLTERFVGADEVVHFTVSNFVNTYYFERRRHDTPVMKFLEMEGVLLDSFRYTNEAAPAQDQFTPFVWSTLHDALDVDDIFNATFERYRIIT